MATILLLSTSPAVFSNFCTVLFISIVVSFYSRVQFSMFNNLKKKWHYVHNQFKQRTVNSKWSLRTLFKKISTIKHSAFKIWEPSTQGLVKPQFATIGVNSWSSWLRKSCKQLFSKYDGIIIVLSPNSVVLWLHEAVLVAIGYLFICLEKKLEIVRFRVRLWT